MNIVLMSNTFTPHVGGVARSVQAFRQAYLARGHRVLVVAPEFAGMEDEEDVVRIPALQNFNTSDFSVALPIPQGLNGILTDFEPDIVHSQHPFLLGMTALRTARTFGIPLVFTHHTLYEEYTHYVPGDSSTLKNFVIELASSYADLCDMVITPSESIARLLRERGVGTPLEVIPTGVEPGRFASGDGSGFRDRHGIPQDAFVAGHMGRLAAEKNLEFLATAAADFLHDNDKAWFLVVGSGDCEENIRAAFARLGLESRLVMPGTLENQALVDALHAMDVFTFASYSETQGMVLTEAMAAGLPVVALEANGVRDVLRDGCNGIQLAEQDSRAFSEALARIQHMDAESFRAMQQAALETADAFSMDACADKALALFARLCGEASPERPDKEQQWEMVRNRISAEWEILKSLARAGDRALSADHDAARDMQAGS